MSSTSSAAGAETKREGSGALNGAVTWLVAVFLVLGGASMALLGALLAQVAGERWVADAVAAGRLTSTELTAAELTSVTNGLLWWGGVGLAVVGAGLVVAGVAFLAYRLRTGPAAGPDTATSAVVGAVVTVLTAFVPLSPVLGGAAAGYLRTGDRSKGVRVGALAGAVAAVPVVVLFAFLIGGFVIVASELALGALTGVVALALVFSLFVAVLYTVGLSALGGYFGAGLGSRGAEDEEYGREPAV